MAMSVEDKFKLFHAANPQVYTMFKRFAYELLSAGAKKIGSKQIVERIRWEAAITTTGAGWDVAKKKRFLLDNSFTPHYSRMFARDFPKLADKFEYREIKTP